MAHVTLLTLPATSWYGAPADELASGDVPATYQFLNGSPTWTLDDDDEEAIITPRLSMPGQFSGTAANLRATVRGFTKTANSDDVNLELFFEALTPNSDTLDMEATSSWDAANDIVHTLGGTAGDPREQTITPNNVDGVQPGDVFRLGLRRDADDATDDDATGDFCFTELELWENTT